MKILGLIYLAAVASAAIVGVDLGYQNTKAIMAAPGISFEIVFTEEGKRKDLSAVFLKPAVKNGKLDDAERVYGSQIGSLCSRFPESCASNIKALLGKTVDDPAVSDYLSSHFGVSLVGDSARNDSVTFALGADANQASFASEELTAMYLNHLKERVLKVLAANPRAKNIAEDIAVSIVPFASQDVRLAYAEALKVSNYSSFLGLVDEGSAVALSYVTNKKFEDDEFDGKKVYEMIYDVGAGSTTATLFSYTLVEGGRIVLDIESVGFDESFGGEYLTRAAYNILYAKFLEQFGLDDSFKLPAKLASRLFVAAEKAKTILSANTEYKVSLESIHNDNDFKAIITREEFEEYNFDAFERAVKPVLDALANAPDGPKSVADIESVILNGGATRTPFIQKQLLALLGSEEKLAKVVNTDEACALGTAYRAYQLKMINSPSDVILKDRIFSNFEISVNDADDQTLVFPRGTYSANETEISLGPYSEDSIGIDLYENGKLFSTYSIAGLTKKIQSLKCSKNEAELFATLSVDSSKIFKLSGLVARCAEKEPVSSESEESTSSASNSTSKKIKAKVPARIPIPEPNFTVIRPFNEKEAKAIINKLDALKEKDIEKIVIEEHKNQLESECYALRSFIEDNFDTVLSELDGNFIEEIKLLVVEIVEWLEFSSDSTLLKEVKEKLKVVGGHRKECEDIIKMLDTDLSLPALEGLYEEGSEVAQQIQDYLLEYGKQINMLRDKYVEDGLDFDKENEKILRTIYGTGKSEGSKLDTHFSEFKQALKDVSEIINLPKTRFQKITQKNLFDRSEAVTNLLMQMMEDVVTLQANHEKRVDYLLGQHTKLTERKKQKDLRKKLKEEAEKVKEEAAKAKADNETVIEEHDAKFVDEDIPTESTYSSQHESSTASSEQSAADEIAHDEL